MTGTENELQLKHTAPKKEKNKRSDKYAEKHFAIDILFDIIASVFYSVGVYTFASAADFAPGGITGLSLIINHYFEFMPIGICSFLLNIPIILICYRSLGKRFLIRTVRSLAIFTFMIDLILPLFPQYHGNDMLASVFAGVLLGVGLALLYSRGSSTGGTDFIVFSIKNKYPHFSVGIITFSLDVIIICIGGIVFKKIEAVLLGLLMTGAATLVLDKVMYGFGAGKMTIIITDKGKEIADNISKQVDRGSTLIKAQGSFTGEEKQVLMCACDKSEAVEVKRVVYNTDPYAVIMISTTDEVYGCGFRSMSEQ